MVSAVAKTDWPNLEAWKARDGSVGGYYFRKRWRENGERMTSRVRMVNEAGEWLDPTSQAFAQKYHDLQSGKPEQTGPLPYSFEALIRSYKSSPSFTGLAPRTKRDYEKVFAYIEDRKTKDGVFMKNMDASRWRRSKAIAMRDGNAHRPRFANYLLQVVSILMKHAIQLEWRSDNPTEGVDHLKMTGPGYRAWPPHVVEAILKSAACDPAVDFGIRIALSVGPRPGDLVRLIWSNFDGEAIDYVQSKTGEEVWAPMLPAMLARMRAEKAAACGLTMLSNERGQPLSYDAFERRFRKVRDRAGVPKGYSLHGLRKNATLTLAEAGCSDDEIKSITGHSTAEMVKLYAKGSRRKALARAAINRVQNASETAGAKRGAKRGNGGDGR